MFFQKIQQLAKTNDNVISDQNTTISYNQLPEIFGNIDRYLKTQNISTTTCLYFQCENTLTNSAFLLYLLYKKQNFLLSPPLNHESVPLFCQYKVVISNTKKIKDPKTYICVTKNPLYQKHSETESSCGKMYMKTSGSMGDSKIVLHEHDKFIKNAQNCIRAYLLNQRDRVLIPVPIFHMYGIGAAFIPSVLAGATIEIQNNLNIIRFLERQRSLQPSVAFLTPAFCKMLLTRNKTLQYKYRVVITAGAQIYKQDFYNVNNLLGTLVNQYGSTEMGAIAVSNISDSLDKRATSTGIAMNGVQVDTRDLADNNIGKLYCNHAYGFNGYVDYDGNTIEKHNDTWFNTGDLANIDQNSYITVFGRSNDSVNRNGVLVMFSDIEKNIEKIEGIDKVVIVLGNEEGRYGQKITAFYTCLQNLMITKKQIRTAALKILPKHFIPDDMFYLPFLPTLPSGKINKQNLKSHYQKRIIMKENIIKQLKTIIREKLDVDIEQENISATESLFEDGIGLDSVAVMEFIALIEDQFNFQFSEEELGVNNFDNLESLSEFIVRKTNS